MDSIENLTTYDLYYQGGEKSLYNQRFGKSKITPREYSLIKNNLVNSINYFVKENSSNEFKMLDFGCGNGRLFKAFEKIILSNLYFKIRFIIICYDVSLVGIKEFKNKLIDDNYTVQNEDFENNISVLEKNNIVIKLVYLKATSTKEQVEEKLGYNYNFILCMFGVLAHIPRYENRQNILNIFYNILRLKGKVLVSIPADRIFKREQLYYNDLRENKDYLKLKAAIDKGDIYYQVKDSEIYNFYHIFSYGEIEQNIKNSSLVLEDTLTYSIIHPAISSNNYLKASFDKFISYIISLKIFPKSLLYKISKYIIVAATKK